jgi:hypothetical protein
VRGETQNKCNRYTEKWEKKVTVAKFFHSIFQWVIAVDRTVKPLFAAKISWIRKIGIRPFFVCNAFPGSGIVLHTSSHRIRQ